MSKFKVIEGTNVTSIIDRNREIKVLESEIKRRTDPSNKELIVFAYRFARLGNFLAAQKLLSNVSSGYYDMMIYKDLYDALCLKVTSSSVSPDEDYFSLTKRSLELFEELNFSEKPAFYRFRKEFKRSNPTLTRL